MRAAGVKNAGRRINGGEGAKGRRGREGRRREAVGRQRNRKGRNAM